MSELQEQKIEVENNAENFRDELNTSNSQLHVLMSDK